MLFLIAVVLAAGFAWIAAKPLQQKPLPFYIGAAVVTVMMILIGQTHVPLGETVFLKYAVDLFNKGALAAALWCVVAYTGALPNGSKAIKRLMPARGELSILAAIVTISHALTWSISYIQRILKFSAAGKSPAADFIANCIVCVLLMCIMLPLTIISFKAVRRKMNAKKWKMIQRAAYLFYALIYVHILIVLIPKVQASRSGALLSVAAYSAVFIGYAVLRLRKLYFRKRQPERTFLPNAVCLTLFALCVAGITGAGVKAAEAQKMKAANAATAETPQETTAAATSAATEPSETAAAPTEAATEQPTKPAEMTEETTGPTEPSETEEVSEAAETSEEEHAPEEQQDAQNQQDPQEQPEPEPEPEPQFTYNNGTFSGHGTTPMDQDKDYEGYVDVRVTIENDVILSVEIVGWGDDPDYYWMAENEIPGRILSAQNPDVDVVCGATRSAEGIRDAVRNALDNARR